MAEVNPYYCFRKHSKFLLFFLKLIRVKKFTISNYECTSSLFGMQLGYLFIINDFFAPAVCLIRLRGHLLNLVCLAQWSCLFFSYFTMLMIYNVKCVIYKLILRSMGSFNRNYWSVVNEILCVFACFDFLIQIELKTAPADFRFPTTNQTRHCFTRYIEFHR